MRLGHNTNALYSYYRTARSYYDSHYNCLSVRCIVTQSFGTQMSSMAKDVVPDLFSLFLFLSLSLSLSHSLSPPFLSLSLSLFFLGPFVSSFTSRHLSVASHRGVNPCPHNESCVRTVLGGVTPSSQHSSPRWRTTWSSTIKSHEDF